MCEGDCDRDSDCRAGLLCFHRTNAEVTPGCTNDGHSDKSTDYCYQAPLPNPSANPSVGACRECKQCDTSTTQQVSACSTSAQTVCRCKAGHHSVRRGTSGFAWVGDGYCSDEYSKVQSDAAVPNIAACADRCWADAQCTGFAYYDGTCMPGKTGVCSTHQRACLLSKSGCASRSTNDFNWQGHKKQSGLPSLDYQGGSACTTSAPCSVCVGDCDADNQCAGSLKCFHRSSSEHVPGCTNSPTHGGSGGNGSSDFCYDAEARDEERCT